MDIDKLLNDVKNNNLSIDDAKNLLLKLPYENMDFARLDFHRALRRGFGEVIFCKGKTSQHIAQIFKSFIDKNINIMGTKATKKQYDEVIQLCPNILFDDLAKIIYYEAEPTKKVGKICICSAGTADLPIAKEASITASFFGANVVSYYDIGVAGIHRIFDVLDELRSANVIIAVAGMEGALPGVLGGLLNKPIIAVPTSVGYGANFNGLSALLTMLNSCAEGISVVNIDNGYGAGYNAAQINKLMDK